jgi:hypothetical protein
MMTTYPKPATPLPWKDEIVPLRRENRDFARHAANAFPHLVAALEGMVEEYDRQTRYGSPMARASNPRVEAARHALAIARGEVAS